MRIYLVAALMLALYLLPWVVNLSASLTPNGYDLAEWTSLHPAARAQTPMLLTSLLLRLPLVCIALVVAFGAPRRLSSALVVLIIAAALLPPEIIPLTDNPNSRQLGALAFGTLIIGMVGVSGVLARYRRWLASGSALIGAVASAVGVLQALELMRGFTLSAQVGAGSVGLTLLFLGTAGVFAVAAIRRQRRHTTNRLLTAVNQTG